MRPQRRNSLSSTTTTTGAPGSSSRPASSRATSSPSRSTILRLPYQGSADRWDIGIYLASDERYTESELPTSFGPRTGTPEEGIDHTFILYAGPSTQH